jgi:alpha-tubulin suppressor-like RCC1 family protein
MLFTCGVTTDHRAYCWGWNRDGNLGDGTFTDHREPHLVAGGHRFLEVSTDAGAPGTHHACAVSTNNRIYCWGVNDAGQLGDGTNNNHYVPHLIPGALRFTAVSAGYYYTCAVTTDQRGYCWGAGDNFQLGTSPIHQSNTPIPVAGIHSFLEIRTGGDHTCGVALNHRGLCWGENHFGQLGDGTTEPKQTPIVVGSGLP